MTRRVLAWPVAMSVATGCLRPNPDFVSEDASTGAGGTTSAQTSSTADTSFATTSGSESGPGSSSGTGATGTSTAACETEADTGPSIETCNAIDDDCDGLVDEVSEQNTMCVDCMLEQVDDRAWYICIGGLTWTAARQTCIAYGAELLSIRNIAENDLVAAQLEGAGGALGYRVWTTRGSRIAWSSATTAPASGTIAAAWRAAATCAPPRTSRERTGEPHPHLDGLRIDSAIEPHQAR